MSEAILDSRREAATVAPSVLAGWAALKSLPARWRSRRRLSGGIAHLDDRLLADVGLDPSYLGLGQRLIRRFAPGGDIWPLDRAGR
jgi:uncharacterized protein YjiS (DUF1127 family)